MNALNNISAGLVRLIEANEPYWGGEAEVIRTYWSSPVRTRDTDRKWLVHQIYKEYWDGIMPPLDIFHQRLPEAGTQANRRKLLSIAEVLREEVEHFTLFADLYKKLEGIDYALSPDELKRQGAWRENEALMALRTRHMSESPGLGQRAFNFTEGGHCALFIEGMALRGRGGFDDAVAEVCSIIYDDEFNHMLLGIVESDDAVLSESDWDILLSYTVTQMKLRIVMRNTQFSFPVSETRLDELLRGEGEPVKFDFDKVKTLLDPAS